LITVHQTLLSIDLQLQKKQTQQFVLCLSRGTNIAVSSTALQKRVTQKQKWLKVLHKLK